MSNVAIIKVSSWELGKKYTCVSCKKGKFEAKETENPCPKCGQLHTIKVGL